jgi:hypothetical protein
LFQNPIGFEQALGKTGREPGFSPKFKVAVPKAEVLEQPHLPEFMLPGRFLNLLTVDGSCQNHLFSGFYENGVDKLTYMH